MKKTLILTAALALVAFPVLAGEWHSGANNLCTDCHTMHFSQQHRWDGSGPISATPDANGNWLGATGPNNFLLKLPANELCLACHDGQTFAPDVFGVNVNTAPTQGRMAGALNGNVPGHIPGGAYFDWKGHTLGSTAIPPGYDPTVIGAPATWYDPSGGLECISCHSQHGSLTAYRNLGSFALGGAATASRPTYVIATTNTATRDVWINLTPPYTANSGNAATFNPFYDFANITYNRNDGVQGTTNYSNRLDNLCASCHGDFHGANTDATVANAQTVAGLDGFIRHPTSGVGGFAIGASGTAGYGGHSALSRFTGATTKVKVYSDAAGYTDAVPGCTTCHKGHGNQNPFGLFFLSRNAASVGEEGGYATTDPPEPANGYQVGYRNLCGQCHSQGN